MVTKDVTEVLNSCGSQTIDSSLSRKRLLAERLGRRVRNLRVAADLPEVDLSFALHLSRAHLEDIENGIEPVDLELLSLLASFFRLSLSDFLVWGES